MASSRNELGYEDERFANDVIQEFHCPICLNVLRNPVMCRRNQHHFCTGCISRHLENFQTCPTCMEELTLETLSPAQRIYTSYLSELKIRCDYFSRGCPEFVQLGNLQSHVVNCGFSPVVCSNEGCAVEINKRDKVHHETEVCELRKAQCHDCVEMRKEIDEVKGHLTEVKGNLTEVKANQNELKENLTEVKGNQNELKENLTEVKENLTEMKGNLAEMKGNLAEMKGNLAEVNDQLKLQMHIMQDEIVNKFLAMIAEIKPVVAERSMKETVQQSSQDPTTEIREDIIVAGGRSPNCPALNSVEMFCWSTKAWVSLEPMNTGRRELSSFVYKDQMVVAGGNTQTQDGTNTIEAMNIDQKPRQWSDFPAHLPTRLCAHKNVVHKDLFFVVGGVVEDEDYSDAIYEVLLVFPYSSRQLHRMPKPRAYHGIELHNNNIFIAGGTTSNSDQDSMASIAKYDINKNEYREVGKLPFAVNEVATVKWKSYIVIIGGINKKGKVFDSVVLYDMEKEKWHTLPSMRHKRKGCTAVVSGNLIVVIGGQNEEGEYLNSVECFSFDQYSWEELPPMLEARYWATAVVKPNQH